MEDPNNFDKNWCIVILKFMGFYWRGFIIIIWPFISALVFIISFEVKIRCLFVLVLMSGYWVTDCIPLHVTGLMPVFLFPLLGVQSTAQVCVAYMNKTNMIFMASILIASGIEHVGLHKRIAYVMIMGLGCSPRRLHFGLTMVPMLLSMWLSNSATTAMMCPIISAILVELEAEGVGSVYKPKEPSDLPEDPPKPTNITTAYYLSAAYASTIGGIGTLVGTGTNLTYKGIYEEHFEEGNTIDFVKWMLFNVPPMFLMSLFAYLTLECIFMGLWRPNSAEGQTIAAGVEHQDAARNVVKRKLAELGKMAFNEVCVTVLFVLLILMWITRKLYFVTGWGDLFDKAIADASPAIIVIFCFAVFPSSLALFNYCTKEKSVRPIKTTTALVPWKVLQEKMPWGLLFLLGGGFAMASGITYVKLDTYLGGQFKGMKNLPPFLVLCLTNLCANFATELTSNVAICNILSPILIEIAVAMEVHPMSFTYTAAVMCSFAFLLPVGTPPNAIVKEHANISTIDMVKGGILLKLFSWAIYMVLYPTYGLLFFEQGGVPDWLKNTTSTPKSI